MHYGAIEAGGTKFICTVANETLEFIDQISIPTTDPQETLSKVFNFFKPFSLISIGIGSFGPIDVNRSSTTYGYITSTPKVAWQNFNFLGKVKEHFNIPIAWTTDVNAAAYGEMHMGAGRNVNSCIYLTVGTGIGGGAVINGQLLQGFSHPEMGHITLKRQPSDQLVSTCPYHSDCLEGLASGPAIKKRRGIEGQNLKESDEIWLIEADYLAQALLDYTLILSPEKIILGGGVMKQDHLIKKIHVSLNKQLNGYVQLPPMEDYVVGCELKDDSGTYGCLLLAKEEAR